jgi:methionyl-tRNA formyltransferase
MPAVNVIVFGYGELGIAAVRAILEAGAGVAAIVVPSNRSGADVDRVAAFAAQQRVPLWLQPPKHAAAPFIRQLQAAKPDLIVVWSYSMVLPPAVLAVPRLGAVNVHGGLLPEYRGGHVMQWAILNGESETGVTLHYMDAGIDTGPVIADARFPIAPGDDAVDVRARLMSAGVDLLRRWWPQIAAGTTPRMPQDPKLARYWRLRTPEEGRIDWRESPERICRLIRALACNQPGAFVEAAGQVVTVRRARALPLASGSEPGRVASAEPDGIRVGARSGDVLISTVLIGEDVVDGTAIAGILTPGASIVSVPLQPHG